VHCPGLQSAEHKLEQCGQSGRDGTPGADTSRELRICLSERSSSIC
jgi:hypothetical protein